MEDNIVQKKTTRHYSDRNEEERRSINVLTNGPILAWGLFYLDPGSGSFLIQLLLGAGLGFVVGAKLYWAKLKSLFSRNKASPVQPDDSEDLEV